MWFSSCLHTLRSAWNSRPTGRCRPAPRFRPQLEALEGRDVPSTLTVTTNLDNNSIGSLRSEIGAAKSGDTIVFAPSLSGQVCRLTGAGWQGGTEVLINKNLNIVGLGANQSNIAGSTSRVFEVAANAQVTLSGLGIADGNGLLGGFDPDQRGFDGLGGGILNFGTLTVNGCTLYENSTFGEGGGIYNAGTLTVSSSSLFANSACFGGGIGNLGTLTVNGSTFSGNSATTAGGGIFNAVSNYFGTAKGLGVLTVKSCTFSDNSATDEGGGIYNGAKATAIVTGCTLSGNTAAPEGGGIYNGGKLTVGDSIFSNNGPDDIFGKFTDKGGNTLG